MAVFGVLLLDFGLKKIHKNVDNHFKPYIIVAFFEKIEHKGDFGWIDINFALLYTIYRDTRYSVLG